MLIEYVALAEKVSDGYTVFVPDFPGFGSEGNTLDAVRKNAREGLIPHIELMLEERLPIPHATSLDNIMKLEESKGCIPLFISVVAPAGKAQRINITMDTALLNAVDDAAHHQHKSRSALIAEATQRLLGEI
ncbi:MAG: hypothetical protein A3E82_00525 [Gammaproteobacteria bacterium RIFCSPHIGHO2_12_FULL_38_11]|nr:MAG: hypothetical protein A3E82_00525 [Gammaproteobacteria bacterium RIFCSPHIGHO2_12_FULL_38_11]